MGYNEANLWKKLVPDMPMDELQNHIKVKKLQLEYTIKKVEDCKAELKILEDELARRRGK